MSIQAVLDEDSFNALDEPLQALYKPNEKNGNYYLNLPAEEAGKLAYHLQEDIEKLKAHNERVLGEKKKFQTRLGELEEQFEQTQKKKEQTPDFEKEREALKASFEEALSAERQRADTIRKQVAESMKQAAITRLRADYNLNETADYVLDKFIQVVPESEGSDQLSVRVFEDGKPAYSAGDFKSPESLVQEWKEGGRHLAIFNAPSKGGTGGRNDAGTPGGNKTMKRAAFDELGPNAKAEFMREGGSLID